MDPGRPLLEGSGISAGHTTVFKHKHSQVPGWGPNYIQSNQVRCAAHCSAAYVIGCICHQSASVPLSQMPDVAVELNIVTVAMILTVML